MTHRNSIVSLIGIAAIALASAAQAQEQVVAIGHTGPLSGPNAFAGKDNENGVRLAVEELNAKKMVVGGKTLKFELQSEDDQCDAKAGVSAAQKLVDSKVKYIMPSSGLATAILGEKCTPLTAQWTTNTYALAAGTARALVKEGKKTWYFVTADYTFGHSLEKDATEVIKADGGSVGGSSRHPFPGNDFSSFLLKAQASKADVIALANAGNDTVNAIKQANEYGITRKQVVAPLLTYISDVHSIGLDKAQGMPAPGSWKSSNPRLLRFFSVLRCAAASFSRSDLRCLRQRPSVTTPKVSRSAMSEDVNPEIILSWAKSSISSPRASR